MIRKVIFGAVFLLACMSMSALEITRYVSPIGTGDGMTPENPTADLGAMLELGAKVDRLTLNVAPGFYKLNTRDTGAPLTFKNIILDGSWNGEGTSDKVHINYKNITFVNSILHKVSFGGNGTIQGGQMLNCVAENGLLRAVLGRGDCTFIHCESKGFKAGNSIDYNKTDNVVLRNCSARDGDYGFEGDNLNQLYVFDSSFVNNKSGGCNISGCKLAYFSDCDFSLNRGYGAVRLIEFDNSGIASFDRCKFEANDVTYNHIGNIYVHSNVSFNDCAFTYNTESHLDSHGIIYLCRPDFRFLNCTFMNNTGGITLESLYPSENQIVNCAFWNNPKGNIYAGELDVPLLSCAMDICTGIPELDAQKGVIKLTEANKGFRDNGASIELEPNSILINRGQPRSMEGFDINKHPRNVFGGTDIGCSEFISSPGLWKPDSLEVMIDYLPYKQCKASVGGKDYYTLQPQILVDACDAHIQELHKDFIYLDWMPVKPKILEGKYIERHLPDVGGGYIVDVLYKDGEGEAWWYPADSMHYDTFKDRPTVKIVDNKVKFIKPATANKPASANRPAASKAGAARKRPVSKTRR